ncbi:MAG TPA: VIT family protein [Planctomycetota bacterium]|nr:VIT family protein [Planctomycetota bacterium]
MNHDDHPHVHRIHRSGWLRAAVLGANDGLVSTASLVMGVAAAQADHKAVLLSGVAGLFAGAMSMAAGEFVSVSSQADTVQADLETERLAIEDNEEFEHAELAEIYRGRGLTPELARQVAEQLMDHDALDAHARDELGIVEWNGARPTQAAIASAVAFAVGAAFPLLVVALGPLDQVLWRVPVSTLCFLAILGAVSARAGGAPTLKAALRVTVLGGLAMAVTAAVGALFGTTVS